MGFIKDIYESAKKSVKEISWKFIEQQSADVKKFFSHWPLVNTVVGGVRDAVSNVLGFAHEHAVKKPIEKIKKNGEETRKAIGKKIDEVTLETGAERDKSLADILRHIEEKVGTNSIDIEEGRIFAAQRKKLSEWTKTKAIPILDRYPSAPLSEADLIEREARDSKRFNAAIKAENDPRYHHQNSPSDAKIASSLVQLINGKRDGAGLGSLRLGKHLSSRAAQRSNYKMSQIHNKSTDIAPLEYLEHPPIERLELEETVPVARYRSGKPQFQLTNEKRKRLVPDSLVKVHDHSYRMKFYESDEDFALRIRDMREKREATQSDDFSLVLDFDEDNYPFDGDPYLIMDKILEKSEHRLALMGEKNEIGIGIARKDSKVVVNFLLKNTENPEPEDEIPLEPLTSQDHEWWLKQIPDEIREPDDDKKINFQELYEAGFDSGYSLYQLYLFSADIENLGHDHDISISSIEFHSKEKIHSKPYDLLHIHISIGKKTHVVKLIKGTDLVDIPDEGTSKREKPTSHSVGRVITLEEYFNKIKDTPEPKSIRFQYKKKTKKKDEEADEEEPEEVDLNNLI